MGTEDRAEESSAKADASRKIIHIDMDAFYAKTARGLDVVSRERSTSAPDRGDRRLIGPDAGISRELR